VAQALNSNGRIVILEQLAGPTPLPIAKASVRILGLSYFYLIDGQIYAYADIAGWLAAAGFTEVRRINLLRAPGMSLIVGTVP